jgi:acetyl esterase/lipase
MIIEIVNLDPSCNVTLTAYICDQSKEMENMDVRPAMLIFPGGGYRFCSDREAEPIALSYNAAGYNAFVLKYSLNADAEFPKPLQDAEKAMETIIENSDKWHIDPERIAVIGFSAGGHLATTLGTMGKIKPKALVLGYPHIFRYEYNESLPSTNEHVSENTPPCFIFHTYEDTIVPVEHSLVFAKALSDYEVPFEMHIFPKGSHGLSLANRVTANRYRQNVNPDFAKWFELSLNWLDKIFDNDQGIDDNEFETNPMKLPLEKLCEEHRYRKILFECIPELNNTDLFEKLKAVTLRQLSIFTPEMVTEDIYKDLENRLS